MDTSGAEGPRLVAFRAWLVKQGRLHSIYKSMEWSLGERVAALCLCSATYGGGMRMYGQVNKPEPPAHLRAPDPDDGECGLYAYDRLETLSKYLRQQSATLFPLVGVVHLWGRVKVGAVKDPEGELKEPGYRLRAEYARVLAVDKDFRGVSSLLGAGQVEMVSRRYLEAWAADAFSGVRYRLEKTS